MEWNLGARIGCEGGRRGCGRESNCRCSREGIKVCWWEVDMVERREEAGREEWAEGGGGGGGG